MNKQAASKIFKLLLIVIITYGLYLSFFNPLPVDNDLLPAIAYFTIQSNILVVLALLFFLFAGHENRAMAIVRGGVMIYILVTGLVFHFLLVPNLPQYFAEGVIFRHHITHTIAPIGFILDWLLFDRKGLMYKSDLKYWVIFPMLYWTVTIIHGNISGLYPYFFMDVGAIGFAAVLTWFFALTTFFVILSFLIVRVDNMSLFKPKARSN